MELDTEKIVLETITFSITAQRFSDYNKMKERAGKCPEALAVTRERATA